MKYDKLSIKKLAVVLIIIFSTSLHLPLSANEDPLTMGIFPRNSAKLTINAFTPLATYLTQKLNRKVKLVTTYDFASFWRGVKEQKYDIVHYNQYHYVRSHKEYGYNVFAMNEEFGKSTISSIILAKKDSDNLTIEDVVGQTIAFGGGPKAMVSYILPLYMLGKANVSSYQFESIFAKNPPNAVMALFFDKADIAGVGSSVPDMSVIKNNIDTSQLIKIAESESIVHLPWAVKNNMPLELSTEIQKLFITLNNSTANRKILNSAKVTNFIVANDSDYDRTREIVLDVIGIQY